MSNSKRLATESNAETLRLHDLMKARNEAALQAVAEMSKRQYSLEEVRAQVEELKRENDSRLGKNTNEDSLQNP